jgi:hypothetical protein
MPRPGIHKLLMFSKNHELKNQTSRENGSVDKFTAENSIQALMILLDFILPQAFRVSTTILDCLTIAS